MQRCWRIRAWTTAVLIGLGTVFGASAARAGIAVSPLKQEISLRPGEEHTITLALAYNHRAETDVPQSLHISAMDVQVSDEGALSFLPPGTMEKSASKWIVVDQSKVTLEAGKSAEVSCKVSPPRNTAPGEYYTVIMVTLDTPGKNEKGVIVQYRIASGLFVTVLGQTFPKQAKINRCELLWPAIPSPNAATQPATQAASASSDPPAAPALPRVSVLLQNTGEARFDAAGKMSVFDERNRLVFTAPFVTKRPCIFGGDSRLFEAPITRMLPAGKYHIRVEMDYQSPWAKARQQMFVDILPQQAEALAALQKDSPQDSKVVEVGAESISASIPRGAARSVALQVRNVSDTAVGCTVAEASADHTVDSWIGLAQEQFIIPKGSRHSMVLRIQIPDDAAPGKYASVVTLDAVSDTGGKSKVVIPVDIDVKAER